MLNIKIICSEPLKLYGEGQYNLNVVKEVTATESYMGLDLEIRGCQKDERYEDCTTAHFIESSLSQCQCLPLGIRAVHKVSIMF